MAIQTINFDNHVVVSLHINVPLDADSTFFSKWGVTYLDGSCEPGMSTNPIFIFGNSAQYHEIEDNYPVIKVTEALKLQLDLTRYDYNEWDVYLKGYKVCPWSALIPASSGVEATPVLRSGYRLTYPSTWFPYPANGHAPLKASDQGIITIPVGEYGFKGWEVLLVSKQEMSLEDRYRTSVDGTEQPFFNNCYLEPPTEPHYESAVTHQDTTFEDQSFPDFTKYSIPYFNIGNRAIKGYGYNGPAMAEQTPRVYSTKEEVAPFDSIKPDRYNYCLKPELVYNDIRIDQESSRISPLEVKVADQQLTTPDGAIINLDIDDEVCVYKFPFQWSRDKQEILSLYTYDQWTPTRASEVPGACTYIQKDTYGWASGGFTTYLTNAPSDLILQDIYRCTGDMSIYRLKVAEDTTSTIHLRSTTSTVPAGWDEVSSIAPYTYAYKYKDYEGSIQFANNKYLGAPRAYMGVPGNYSDLTQETGSQPITTPYIKNVTYQHVPYFLPTKGEWDGLHVDTSSNGWVSSEESGTTNPNYTYKVGLLRSCANTVLPYTYLIYDNATWTSAECSYVTLTTENEVALYTKYSINYTYYYAIVVWHKKDALDYQ